MPDNAGAAALAMVKDECDIVEAFVRHNLAHVDHLHVIDDGSEDGTLQILMRLCGEGLPLSIYRSDGPHFRQGAALSALMRQIAASQAHRWFLLLDADEFIQPSGGRALGEILAALPEDRAALMTWANGLPLMEWQPGPQADLRASFAVATADAPSFWKVLVPGALARAGQIGEGNHAFRAEGENLPPVHAPIVLQHLPVRSAAQIVAKALVGSARLAIKPGRFNGEGGHWDRIADRVRQRQYRLDLLDLQCIARRYPDICDPSELRAGELTRFQGPALTLRYSDAARPDVCARLDRHIGRLNRMLVPAT